MQVVETMETILAPYPVNTAVISYRENGERKLWFIGAIKGLDNYESLKAHLAKVKPKAEFLWWAIK